MFSSEQAEIYWELCRLNGDYFSSSVILYVSACVLTCIYIYFFAIFLSHDLPNVLKVTHMAVLLLMLFLQPCVIGHTHRKWIASSDTVGFLAQQ